jgi:hypothetical protein
MKSASTREATGLRPEYDFASMRGGVRGKYARQFKAGTTLVLLEPEVAEAFPTASAVNEALRAVLRATRVVRRASRLPNKASQQTRSTPSPKRKRGPRS